MTIWQNISSNEQILIIHPNYRQHRYLLSTLLSFDDVIYWRFDESQLNISTWLSLIHEYSLQQSSAGHLEFIILDEFDRLEPHYAQVILNQLIRDYKQSRIVLFSRHLPQIGADLQMSAMLFPIDEEMLMVNYYEKQPRTVVEAFGFGRGSIVINGKRVEAWDGELPRLLLFYLLGKEQANRDEILQVFWPEQEPKVAIQLLQNTKSRLNEILRFDLVIYQKGYYQFNPEIEIHFDVANYHQLIESALHAPPSLKATIYSQAYDLYTGDFLLDSNYKWVQNLRRPLKNMQSEVNKYLAELHLEQSEIEKASAWFMFAFKHQPARDDLVEQLMQLFLDLNKPCFALKLYKRYSDILQERLNIQPQASLQAVAKKAEEACLK